MRIVPVLFMAMAAIGCGSAKKVAEPSVETATVAVEPQVEKTLNHEVMKKPDIDIEKVFFSAALLREAIKQQPEDNVILSPFSAGVAFSMLSDGARSTTRDGLVNAMQGSSYYGDFPRTDSVNIVKTANSIWLNTGLIPKEGYINTLKNAYRAEVYAADNGDPFTVSAINAWCAKHTEGLIREIIAELPDYCRMVLMNALYFKAPWAIAFNKESTYKETFHGEKGDSEVDFMHNTSSDYEVWQVPGCNFVNLRYKDGKYAMLLAIPDDMASAQGKIGPDKFQEAVANVHSGMKVRLSLPKFKTEYTRILNDIMISLGAGEVFTPKANLSGISNEALFVSLALQKCVLDVNEEGSEAAAVTAIIVTRSTAVRPEPIIDIKVDKPFFFAIYDVKSQNILFEGKIANL